MNDRLTAWGLGFIVFAVLAALFLMERRALDRENLRLKEELHELKGAAWQPSSPSPARR